MEVPASFMDCRVEQMTCLYQVSKLQTVKLNEMTPMFCQAFLTMWVRKTVFL